MYCARMGQAEIDELRRGYAALNRGDVSVVVELLDPELEGHEPGHSPEAGTHRGRDGFERFLRGWLESFEGFRVEPERIVERGDDLIVVVRQTGAGRSSGVEVETRLVHVWTVANGRAVRWEAVPDVEAALGDGVYGLSRPSPPTGLAKHLAGRASRRRSASRRARWMRPEKPGGLLWYQRRPSCGHSSPSPFRPTRACSSSHAGRVQCASDAPSQTMASDPTKIAPSSACACGRRMCQPTSPATRTTSASFT